MTLNHRPLTSGTGSSGPWRVFIVANRALNGTPGDTRAHRRQVHELAMTDPHSAARR